LKLNQPVVGMAESNGGSGYWLVASDGGLFAYNAPFFGSTGAIRLNEPVVGMAADSATGGYWLVASDGGIFAYNAPFFGSTGSIVLNEPIVGMEANVSGTGYRFVASDGGVFPYGTSGFYGSAVATNSSAGAPTNLSAVTCTVSMSNPSPPPTGTETATIQSTAPNTQLLLEVAFGNVIPGNLGAIVDNIVTTDGRGDASLTFSIAGATVGYKVQVFVVVAHATPFNECATTSFTPV